MKCAHFTCHACSPPHEDVGRTAYVVAIEQEVATLRAEVERLRIDAIAATTGKKAGER